MRAGLLQRPVGWPLPAHCLESRWERLRGLMGRPAPEAGSALLIPNCDAVHTAGLSYPIDVVFLNHSWKVLRVVTALKPWRLSISRGAAHVLEMAPGEAKRCGLEPGLSLGWTQGN